MKNKVDPNKYPEWYSAQYTEKDRKLIKEICEKTRENENITGRKGIRVG